MARLGAYYLVWQRSLFNPHGSLLFIHSEFYNFIFIILTVVLVIITFMYFFGYKYLLKRFFKLNTTLAVLIVVFLIITAFSLDTCRYTYIKDDGIYVKSSIFNEIKYYRWENVENVDAGYHFGSGKNIENAYIDYYINLSDGTKVDVMYSVEIWNKILRLDEFFLNKGIIYNKQKIDNDTYKKLKSSNEDIIGKNTEYILKRIFIVE